MPKVGQAKQNGKVYYPITIPQGIVDPATRERLDLTIARLEKTIEEERLKVLGDAGTQSPTAKYAKNSLVTCTGMTFLSTKEVTGLPDAVVDYNGEVVTHDGEAVTYGEAPGDGWSKIAG